MWVLPVAVLALSLAGAQAQGPEPGTAPAPAAQLPGLRQFSGSPIDVDYQSASLRTVLRQLSEIGGMNIVIDPSVPAEATVDLKLTQVPWDQVMDVVLKSSGLTYELEGAVLRVLTREALTLELQAEAQQKLASEQAPDLETLRLRLNYAPASQVKDLLEQARIVSDRGSVDFDERSNMIIIQDTPARLAEIRLLLNDLDRPEPQVEIEARIVQANRDTARALGVQWGFNGRMTPEIGNTTGLAFPNSGTASGRVTEQGPVTQRPNDPRSGELDATGTAVNLPVPGATSAVGLSMGAINGAFNLDVALSALEREGNLKIVSTPRVTTQNNRQAEVTQGFEIPIQVVANNTVTVQFKPAALRLVVTPQITAANTVIMRIELENGFPDFSRAVNGNPSISTQKAITQVQVPDGMTTVIGGIVTSRESMANDRTPGLANIPLLGWLFRRTSNSNESQDLMIFLTPRIIRSVP
ncbi:MAG TPA: type IV pilus secretin PilQ [Vicinamibacterales bacterium]|nr:type IV pilus secretin PilQ [Vicinamibacterales bacterium]